MADNAFEPSASLLRAVLVAGASTMSSLALRNGKPTTLFDVNQGFGRVDLSHSLPLKGVSDADWRLLVSFVCVCVCLCVCWCGCGWVSVCVVLCVCEGFSRPLACEPLQLHVLLAVVARAAYCCRSCWWSWKCITNVSAAACIACAVGRGSAYLMSALLPGKARAVRCGNA